MRPEPTYTELLRRYRKRHSHFLRESKNNFTVYSSQKQLLLRGKVAGTEEHRWLSLLTQTRSCLPVAAEDRCPKL